MGARAVVLWPARETWRAVRRTERGVVGAGARVTLRGFDAALRSPYADDAVRRVAESDLPERFVSWALAAGVPQRIAERLLADGAVERLAVRVLDGPELDRIVEHALDSAALRRLADELAAPSAVRQRVA